MKNVICIKDYDYFDKGNFYYAEENKLDSGSTYSIFYKIYDMNNKHVSDIGYLFSEVFQDVHERRKEIINSIL